MRTRLLFLLSFLSGLSCITVLAQILPAKDGAQLVVDVYKTHGLVGIQSLFLAGAMVYITWLQQKHFAIQVKLTGQMREWIVALNKIVTAFNERPCQHPMFPIWCAQQTRDKQNHIHDTQDPFATFEKGETPQ